MLIIQALGDQGGDPMQGAEAAHVQVFVQDQHAEVLFDLVDELGHADGVQGQTVFKQRGLIVDFGRVQIQVQAFA